MPFKSAPTLVGTYSGNQTINVSSVIGANDTVNNFIVEIVSVNRGNYLNNYYKNEPVDIYGFGSTVAKNLSGSTLTISGMQGYVYIKDYNSLSVHASIYQSITYKVWHV